MSNPNYIITEKAIIITMYEALYGSKFYIRDKYLQIAKKKNIPIVLKTPLGTATFTAKQWLKDADKMEKVFNFPDNPMILWGNFAQPYIEKRTTRKKIEKEAPKEVVSVMQTLFDMPEKYRKQIRKLLK